MSITWDVIQSVLDRPSRFIAQRTDLNLPRYAENFPFSQRQKQAVELILSNAPVVTIAGLPGSGKTEIALAALETAYQHQRSTLIVAPWSSVFNSYQENLSMPPLAITNNLDYRTNVKNWLRQELAQPKLNFLPLYWLEDHLFEDLQTKKGYQYWLNLLNIENLEQRDLELDQAVANGLPDIHPQRQKLLVHRLKQSVTLLEHRNRLFQDYSTLSETAIEEIVDATLSHIKAPLLCLPEHLSSINDRLFDLVIVESSDHLSPSQLKTIARRGKKVVLLGELIVQNSFFNTIFQHLSPAYRIKLEENHRLHPDLAHKIFPNLFDVEYAPYTPFNSKYKPLPSGSHYRLVWQDIKISDQLLPKLQESLANSGYEQNTILTLTQEAADHLRQNLDSSLTLSIDAIVNCHRKECQALWIILDAPATDPIPLQYWRLALTRASQMITILGDKEFYPQVLQSLETEFHFVRDLIIQED